ncbi:hypothetical protein UM764_09795 [Staphylococcus aureus]|nr:hypothetical protein UM764_09795 [Staphylococcus aureus]
MDLTSRFKYLVIFPWTAGQGKVARLICDVYKTDGTPFEGNPRANLNVY